MGRLPDPAKFRVAYFQSALAPGMDNELARLIIESIDNHEMIEILCRFRRNQGYDRDVAGNIILERLKRSGGGPGLETVFAGGYEQIEIKASGYFFYLELIGEVFRADPDPVVAENHGQGGRTALLPFLRNKGNPRDQVPGGWRASCRSGRLQKNKSNEKKWREQRYLGKRFKVYQSAL